MSNPPSSRSESDYDDSDSASASPSFPTSTSRSTEAANNLENSPDSEPDYDDNFDANSIPFIQKRIPKAVAVAGKAFSIKIDGDTFADSDPDDVLTLQFLDKHDNNISQNSWIQFDEKKREIYGLPLESDVSRHDFKVKATDKAGASVEETFEITVQQFKGSRSYNHEIAIKVKLEKTFKTMVDWEIRLLRGVVEALEDGSIENIIVREVTQHNRDPKSFTFIFTNDSLPKQHCPKQELDQLMTRLNKNALNIALENEFFVKSVDKELVGNCKEKNTTRPVLPSGKNYSPTLPNPIDRIKASIGQLLVFPVPSDTFYDPEDQYDLKLTLLKENNRAPIEPSNWLQFDSRNKEFFGVPTIRESNDQGYILVAEDKEGLQKSDALVVEIGDEFHKKDLSVNFEYNLDIPSHQFNHAAMKRKFIESIAKIFNDSNTDNVVIGNVKEKYDKRTSVFVHNATLKHDRHEVCPDQIIEELRNKILRADGSVQDRVKEILGSDFPVNKINVSPMGELKVLTN